jgi:hypothetical protein
MDETRTFFITGILEVLKLKCFANEVKNFKGLKNGTISFNGYIPATKGFTIQLQ